MSLARAWHSSLCFHTKHGPHHTVCDKAFATIKGHHSLQNSSKVEQLLQHFRKVALGTQNLGLRHHGPASGSRSKLPYEGRGDPK